MKNIWILNQYNMPPEYGHLNRHYNFGKYLKRFGYNPVIFVGSYLHNTGIQMVQDKSLYSMYKTCEYPYVFVRTCDYSKSMLKRVYAMFEFCRNLFKIVRNFEKPDIIIGSSAHPLACIAAIHLAKKYRCMPIVEIRDLWPESFVAYDIMSRNNIFLKLFYAGEKWIYKKADKLIFTMEGGRDYIIEKGWDKAQGGPIDLSKVFHINNGVDMEVFNYNKENYVLDDEDLNNENTFKVIYTGSVRLANNIHILVEAAEKIWEMGEHNIKLIIYGDGDLLPELKRYVETNKISNIVFKGSINKKYIPGVLSRGNLNILDIYNSELFRFGTSPNKLFDYLASGKPVLSGPVCNYDIVKQNNCGTTLQVVSADEIARQIIEYSHMTKKETEQFGKNAIMAAEKYDFSNLSKKLIEIIEMG